MVTKAPLAKVTPSVVSVTRNGDRRSPLSASPAILRALIRRDSPRFQAAVAEPQHTIGHPCRHLLVVRDHDDRRAQFAMDLADQSDHLAGR